MSAQNTLTQTEDQFQKEYLLFAILTSQRDIFIKYHSKFDFADVLENPFLNMMVSQQKKEFIKTGIYRDWQELFLWIKTVGPEKKLPMSEYDHIREQTEIILKNRVVNEPPTDLEKRLVLLIKDKGLFHLLTRAADRYRNGHRDFAKTIVEEATQLVDIEKTHEIKILDITNLSSVEPRQLKWFWKDRIPQGKLTIIAGNPNVGKSWFSLWIAAQVTQGAPWPDCPTYNIDKGRVLILANEDSVSDTIVPRLLAAGADTSLVEVINGTTDENGSKNYFSLVRDIEALEKVVIEKGDVKLLIIDPIKAFIGTERNVDGNSDQDVRTVLTPLCELAEKQDITIIGLMHFNKKIDLPALDRINGSGAWGARARSVWTINWDPTNVPGEPKRRLFVPVKNNLSPENYSIVFTIEEGEIIIKSWDEMIDANELTNADNKRSYKNKKTRAKELLSDALADGPVEAKILYELAAEDKISASTLDNAKDALSINSFRSGGSDGLWFWQMPSQNN